MVLTVGTTTIKLSVLAFYGQYGLLLLGIACWDSPERCTKLGSGPLVLASFDLALDITVLITPFPMLGKYQMSGRKKVELSVVFLLGYMACAVSLARVIISARNSQALKDPTWGLGLLYIATSSEQPTAIVSASIPATYPLMKEYFNRAFRAAHTSITDLTPHTRRPRERSPEPILVPSFGSDFDTHFLNTQNEITIEFYE